MRLLFEMKPQDCKEGTRNFVRHSSRCIAIEDGRVAMVHSLKYDYYKFPGGGIEENESKIQALLRETQEEAGLLILPDSVREFGYVHRIETSDWEGWDCFVQDNFYYLCRVQRAPVSQRLDEYEAEEGFTLEWVEPERAIMVNRTVDHGPKNQNMLEREARVLEILKAEGYFEQEELGRIGEKEELS